MRHYILQVFSSQPSVCNTQNICVWGNCKLRYIRKDFWASVFNVWGRLWTQYIQIPQNLPIRHIAKIFKLVVFCAGLNHTFQVKYIACTRSVVLVLNYFYCIYVGYTARILLRSAAFLPIQWWLLIALKSSSFALDRRCNVFKTASTTGFWPDYLRFIMTLVVLH